VSLLESSSSPTPSEPRGILVRRQGTNIYTVLLLIAVVALALSSLIMILEWMQYGFQYKPPASMRSAAIAVPFDAKV
jgi:cytochrome b subunit of formate dehydrogenase